MKWLLYVLGVIFAALGVVWILQGTNVLQGGMMGGHIGYAVLGLVAVVIGILLFRFGNRRSRIAS
jgi:uncharacterized membrane-anchored protein YitT (DUF2179 family)